MTPEEYADRIIDEAALAIAMGADRRVVGLLSGSARERVRTAGLEYQHAEGVQGFEVRKPTELVIEVEDELSDAFAWAVGWKARMALAGVNVSVTAFLIALAQAQAATTGWWSDSRTVEEDQAA